MVFIAHKNPVWNPHMARRSGARSFDTRLTAFQRVITRFGGYEVPSQLTVEIDKTKSLRETSGSLTGILDTLRYMGFLSHCVKNMV